ncbi:MAG: cell wall protein [Proteobacteria bacterium]|nr:cell wall protein [Cystobacterineae bacterium]MCL2259278.1 cell wall protein [Cystobacterineae bacterium]MCL2314332.1 cell wall protein [Pseudomonadota bacterium]
MSIEKALRQLISAEIDKRLEPLERATRALEAQSSVVNKLASLFGGPGMNLKRGQVGRPRKQKAQARGVEKASDSGRNCAITTCHRAARSKGYCAAHYQKFRMLARTGRLPSTWVEHASPSSIEDVMLPRGRAGARALAESRIQEQDAE